jgi:hypothetical protein
VTRTCQRTGLALVESPASSVYRIATTSYGPLEPKTRESTSGEDVLSWSRFDTPGRTVYAVDSRRAAFVEATSWARQEAPRSGPLHLSKMAADFGISVEELASDIDGDWGPIGSMNRGWLPTSWRDGRRIYSLNFRPGSWVDVTHSDTLGILSDQMRVELYELGINLGLTLADVTSDNRALTTVIATWLRNEVTLDDGKQPLGIRFQSKHGRHDDGDGICWAYWMREADAGVPTTEVTADAGTSFAADDSDYMYALNLHNIESR